MLAHGYRRRPPPATGLGIVRLDQRQQRIPRHLGSCRPGTPRAGSACLPAYSASEEAGCVIGRRGAASGTQVVDDAGRCFALPAPNESLCCFGCVWAGRNSKKAEWVGVRGIPRFHPDCLFVVCLFFCPSRSGALHGPHRHRLRRHGRVLHGPCRQQQARPVGKPVSKGIPPS